MAKLQATPGNNGGRRPPDADRCDLCEDCSLQAACPMEASRVRPMASCPVYVADKATDSSTPAQRPDRSSRGVPAKGRLFGLCATCQIREECPWPKPLGGVWHCEHYR